MKKILVCVFILLIGLAYLYSTLISGKFAGQSRVKGTSTVAKRPIIRIGLVADSENDNADLKKALDQLRDGGVDFVIGLGDWSRVGTTDELTEVKDIFDASKLTYYLTAGSHDLWDSRNRGEEAFANYKKIFGDSSRVIEDKNGIHFVIVDNSDIYKGISPQDWKMLEDALGSGNAKLIFIFAHKTPFHPDSKHVMGQDSPEVARQAQKFLDLLQAKKIDGFFSGDLHFFAKFKSPDSSVKITTIGAVSAERNSQGPRFGVLTVFDDYSWEVEDIEIR